MMDPMPLPCITKQIHVRSNDRVLLYSDGLIEVENCSQSAFGVEGLTRSLTDHCQLHGQQLNNSILTQAESFGANGFQDDVLLMSISIK